MTGAVTYQYTKRQYRDLRTSPQARQLIEKAAKVIAARAGEGFEPGSPTGKSRARRVVLTATPGARARQASDHVLERAVGMGPVV